MTDQELTLLLKFLVGGFLAGITGRWLDLLVAYIKGR